MTGGPTFTVFTSTFNRRGTLPRVYESLVAQTFDDFEWLVVDDGSTDGTGDLVAGWARTATFPIRWVRQPNLGKHVALNRGVARARGRFFLILDSDDWCVPTALERFLARWDEIPAEERDGFVGVTALCVDQHGRLVGTPFPCDPLDSTILETTLRFRVKGEKWGFQRTKILRAYPFPEPPGYSGYVPEAIVWCAIAERYRTRYVNEALRVYWHDEREYSDQVTRAARMRNAPGALLYSERLLNEHLDWLRGSPVELARRAVQYSRSGLHVGRSPRDQFLALHRPLARVVWVLTFPAAVAAFALDRRTPA